MREQAMAILEAAEENCRNNRGDWSSWTSAQELCETYTEISTNNDDIAEIELALTELKEYEASIRTVLTGDGIEQLVHTSCPDGEFFLYKTPWNAWMDRNGERPWLACGCFMKTGI